MTARKNVPVPRLALTLPEAAQSVGVSVDKLRQHIKRNELVASYIDFKPVIRIDELERWLTSRSAEPAERA